MTLKSRPVVALRHLPGLLGFLAFVSACGIASGASPSLGEVRHPFDSVRGGDGGDVPALYAYREFFVDPDQGNDRAQGSRSEPFRSIAAALRVAESGDRIRLLPGRFAGPVRISVSGEPERPIVISSADPADPAVIDGGWSGTLPGRGDRNAAFIFENTSWFVIENLRIENSWNRAIEVTDTSYVTFRGLDIPTAGYAVHSNGDSHHILIEDTFWQSAGREYWEDWTWREIKDGRYNYLAQGTILGGTSLGSDIIRRNRIAYAFNGHRQAGIYNTEVYGNYFHHSRDNHIEPEMYIWNYHVYHNRLDQCSEFPISIDSCLGGYMYLYGNTGYMDLDDLYRPGNHGKLFKMVTSQLRFLEYPLYIFHNSWYNYGLAFRPNRYQRNVYHFNNAYALTDGLVAGSGGPEVQERWLLQFSEDNKHSDYNSDRNPWPDLIRRAGQEKNGLENTDPMFRDPKSADFRLLPGSPLRDRGKVIEGFTQSFEGAAPDIGAYQGDKLVEGPPFFVRVPPDRDLGYVERPRITRHRINGERLELFFSWPLDHRTVHPSAVHLWADGAKVSISDLKVDGSSRRVSFNASQNLDGADLRLWMDPLPTGVHGEPATHWGSTIKSPW